MSATYEGMSPGGHETYATSIFSKIKTYLDDLETIEKTASGAIATFDDGSDLPMPKLEVAIEPQQDLHGYDSPWVGGVGKNKANPDLLLNGYTSPSNRKYDDTTMAKTQFVKTEGLSTITISATNGNRCYVCYYNDLPNVGDEALTNVTLVATSLPQTITVDTSYTYVAIQVCYNTSGANVSNVQVESGSTATSFTPYSNICPISGHTEANVSVVGKNLFDKTKVTVGKFISSQGVETASGQMAHSDYIRVKSNTTYYTNADVTGMFYIIALYDENKNFMNIIKVASPTSFNTSTASYVIINTAVAKTSIDDMYVIEGSSATAYEPYNGSTYNIQFKDGDNPLTVYGGSLDVVSGELVVDRAYVDMGSLTWTYQSAQTVFSTNISGLKRGILICSNYKYTDVNNVERMNDGEIWDKGNAFSPTNVVVKDLRYTSASDFKQAMSGVQLVYELATPITYQLTPTQVKSLLGSNNIWADTGDVNVIYFRNAKSTQAIKDIIDTTTAKDIVFTKYKGLPTNVQEAINQTYDNVIALNENMADYYFERQSYNVDDYVRYEDPYYGGYNLYRCINNLIQIESRGGCSNNRLYHK